MKIHKFSGDRLWLWHEGLPWWRRPDCTSRNAV